MNDDLQLALKKMVEHPERISDVSARENTVGINSNELFFTYNHKTRWSISKDGDSYYVFFYPKSDDYSVFLNHQAAREESKILTKALFAILERKLFNFDQVLKEIISGK